jgi:hypothetical protein
MKEDASEVSSAIVVTRQASVSMPLVPSVTRGTVPEEVAP